MKRRNSNRNLNDRRNDSNGISHGDYLEIEEKIRNLENELKLIDQGTHPEQLSYNRGIDVWLDEQKQRLQVLNENMNDEALVEYKKEMDSCEKDLDNEKRKLQEILLSIYEDLKNRMEEDKKNIELTASGDVLEHKPQSTRKLRRRGQYGGNNGSTQTTSGFVLSDILFNSTRWNSRASLSHPATDTNDSLDVQVSMINREDRESPYGEKDNKGTINQFGSLSLSLSDDMLLPAIVLALKNQGSLTMANILNEVVTNEDSHLVHKYPFLVAAANNSASSATLSGMYNSNVPSLAGLTNKNKRRVNNSSAQAQLNLQLNENDIYSDLNLIQRSSGKPGNTSMSTRKQHQINHNQFHDVGARNHESYLQHNSYFRSSSYSNACLVDPFSSLSNTAYFNSSSRIASPAPSGWSDKNSSTQDISCWIDDGRLYYKQKCFQVGAHVVLDGRDGSCHGCNGVIHLIGAQDISIRRSSDHGISKVTIQQLKQGRLKLWFNDKDKMI